MGVRRKTYYDIECNFCKNCLSDYVPGLSGKATERGLAEDLATSKGWKKEGSDTWKCPECLKPKKFNPDDLQYESIISIAARNGFEKKIMVRHKNWSNGDWCIVNKLVLDKEQEYGYAYGYIHYANGTTENRYLENSRALEWKLIKILNEPMAIGEYKHDKSSSKV